MQIKSRENLSVYHGGMLLALIGSYLHSLSTVNSLRKLFHRIIRPPSLVPRPTRAMRANRAASERLGTERDSARPGKK